MRPEIGGCSIQRDFTHAGTAFRHALDGETEVTDGTIHGDGLKLPPCAFTLVELQPMHTIGRGLHLMTVRSVVLAVDDVLRGVTLLLALRLHGGNPPSQSDNRHTTA